MAGVLTSAVETGLAAALLGAAGLEGYRALVLYGRREVAAAGPQPWWRLAPEVLPHRPLPQLFLVSVGGLFLELLLIRWISSEVRIFAYFKNLVLVACYLGFGLGCYLAARRVNLLALLLPMLAITALIKAPWTPLRSLIAKLPALIGSLSGVDVWGVPSMPLGAGTVALAVAAVASVVPFFVLLALIFVPVGQLVGWYLEHAERGIHAYSVNVAGSLVGILLYTGLCFLAQPPAVWLAVAGLLIGVVLRASWRAWVPAVAAFGACAALASLQPSGKTVYWSPYQKLSLSPVVEGSDTTSLELETNGSWYQHVVNLSPDFIAAHPALFAGEPPEWNPYNLPYRFAPHPARVLVLGAGMGNDVAGAVRNGAGQVDAVEIDPLILSLGRRLHFERPYASPRVRVVVDDARSFVENTAGQYDLILYSLLDSHTTSSNFTNIRIDNYVYTEEAMQAAKRLLAPGGVLVLKFQANQPWIGGRIRALLQRTFDVDPVHFASAAALKTGTGGSFFIAADSGRLARIRDVVEAAPAEMLVSDRVPAVRPTTDDWPYFYQHEPGLPGSVILVSAALALLGWGAVRRAGTTREAPAAVRAHFFFLGAAFLLLEAQIVSRVALLFGTTWVVNSIVISGLLSLILVANGVVAAWPRMPAALPYVGLTGACMIGFVVPVHSLLVASVPLRIALASLVLCLPVFFAGLAFLRSYQAVEFAAGALGDNLFGALVGGLLEALSLWTGIRSLLVAAVALYVAAWITRPAEKRSRVAVAAGRVAA